MASAYAISTGVSVLNGYDVYWTVSTPNSGTAYSSAAYVSTVNPYWVSDSPLAYWIGPQSNQGTSAQSTTGFYTYSMTFYLSQYATTSYIPARISADHYLLSINLNGNYVYYDYSYQCGSTAVDYNAFTYQNLYGSYLTYENNLEVVVYSCGGSTGLLVELDSPISNDDVINTSLPGGLIATIVVIALVVCLPILCVVFGGLLFGFAAVIQCIRIWCPATTSQGKVTVIDHHSDHVYQPMSPPPEAYHNGAIYAANSNNNNNNNSNKNVNYNNNGQYQNPTLQAGTVISVHNASAPPLPSHNNNNNNATMGFNQAPVAVAVVYAPSSYENGTKH